jgi:hypothetical protein
MPRQSSQARAHDNAILVRQWIESTDLATVPVNQFGTAARTSICKILKISRSSIGSNPLIKQLFDELDRKLSHAGKAAGPRTLLEKEMDRLSEINNSLLQELEDARACADRLQYLEDTAILLFIKNNQ